jgi:hypothetical protein
MPEATYIAKRDAINDSEAIEFTNTDDSGATGAALTDGGTS